MFGRVQTRENETRGPKLLLLVGRQENSASSREIEPDVRPKRREKDPQGVR